MLASLHPTTHRPILLHSTSGETASGERESRSHFDIGDYFVSFGADWQWNPLNQQRVSAHMRFLGISPIQAQAAPTACSNCAVLSTWVPSLSIRARTVFSVGL